MVIITCHFYRLTKEDIQNGIKFCEVDIKNLKYQEHKE